MASPRSFRLTSRALHGEPGPLGFCWHWTGGVCRPGYAGVLAKRISTYDAKKDRAASWHLVAAEAAQGLGVDPQSLLSAEEWAAVQGRGDPRVITVSA